MASIFSWIFDVFSLRPDSRAKPEHHILETTRKRVFMWTDELFSGARPVGPPGDYREAFWQEIHRFLRYRHGKIGLSSGPTRTPEEDAFRFLLACPGEEFLDFLEYIFRVNSFTHVTLPENQVVEELNELLQQDSLRYHVTALVKEEVREIATEPPFAGREMRVIRTVAYPKVIMKESAVVHSQVIGPALELLQHPAFRNANAEYLAALEDYRKGNFGDSLTKAGSTFESVLKILCQRKDWTYRQTDTAAALVKIILSNTSLDSYFEPMLMIVATLRNRLSTSHGAGPAARSVPRHLARYALNATASSILLLADETRQP